MNNSNKKVVLISVFTLLVGIALGWVFFHNFNHVEEQMANPTEESTVWTCSMHPQIRKQEAGDCPICGMDLIPVSTFQDSEENTTAVNMSDYAIKLADIETAKVGATNTGKVLTLNGKIDYNEERVVTQTAHIPGRIEQLAANFTGKKVSKGDVLAYVYSPDLVTAQEELLQAEKYKDSNPELFEAAKSKLSNWKLNSVQINYILESGSPVRRFPVMSEVSGVITEKMVNEGNYVKQGQPLFQVADLSKLWIQFDVYEKDLAEIEKGDSVQFTVDAVPSKTFGTVIAYVDPYVNKNTRVAHARAEVPNNLDQLKPEMFVKGTVLSNSQASEPDQMVVPKSAVMYTGKRSLVYVKEQSPEGVFFDRREVVLGQSSGDNYIIESGLRPGEEIAVYGTFNIDAAAQLQDKPSMMNTVNASDSSYEMSVPEDIVLDMRKWVDAYLRLKESLATDDLETAKKNTVVLGEKMRKIDAESFSGPMQEAWKEMKTSTFSILENMQEAEDLESFRSTFFTLSNNVIKWLKQTGSYGEPLYIQHCPMAKSTGADWISNKREVENPYYGASMLKCGEVRDVIE